MATRAPFLINEGAEVYDFGETNVPRILERYRGQFEGGIHEPSGKLIVTDTGNRDYTLAREAFVKNEVDFLWAVAKEKLVPSSEKDQAVWVGQWVRHYENHGNDGLYVRVTEDSIALARDLTLGFRETPSGWFYEWKKNRGYSEGRMEIKRGIPLVEVIKASDLCTEFEKALDRRLPHYA